MRYAGIESAPLRPALPPSINALTRRSISRRVLLSSSNASRLPAAASEANLVICCDDTWIAATCAAACRSWLFLMPAQIELMISTASAMRPINPQNWKPRPSRPPTNAPDVLISLPRPVIDMDPQRLPHDRATHTALRRTGSRSHLVHNPPPDRHPLQTGSIRRRHAENPELTPAPPSRKRPTTFRRGRNARARNAPSSPRRSRA